MNEYIRLEPISFINENNRYIDFQVNCSFCDDINFYRGNFKINTGKFFSVRSYNCPELSGDDVLYIQGSNMLEDNTILRAPLQVFIFINTQVKIADEMLKALKARICNTENYSDYDGTECECDDCANDF